MRGVKSYGLTWYHFDFQFMFSTTQHFTKIFCRYICMWNNLQTQQQRVQREAVFEGKLPDSNQRFCECISLLLDLFSPITSLMTSKLRRVRFVTNFQLLIHEECLQKCKPRTDNNITSDANSRKGSEQSQRRTSENNLSTSFNVQVITNFEK